MASSPPPQKKSGQKENKKPKKGGQKGDGGGGGGGVTELNPWPGYIQDRIVLWDKHMARYKEEIAAKTPSPIKVTLPDGNQFDGESWRTTPYEVAQRISQGGSIVFFKRGTQ